MLRRAKAAWIEQLWAGAALLAILPILNAFTTARPFWRSAAQGDWIFLTTDLMFLALAALHVVLALRAARDRPRTRPARKQRPEAIRAVLQEERV